MCRGLLDTVSVPRTYWWTASGRALLIGQVLNRRVSTASEWILSVDLSLFFLTFLTEFTRLSFDILTPKIASSQSTAAHDASTLPA